MANILEDRRMKVPLQTLKLLAILPTHSSQDSKEKEETVDNVKYILKDR
jgi:hypothetical protein